MLTLLLSVLFSATPALAASSGKRDKSDVCIAKFKVLEMKDGIGEKMYRAHLRFRNFPSHERRCVLDVFDRIAEGMGEYDCHYTSDIDRHVLSSLDGCIDGLAKVRDSLEKMRAEGNLHLTYQNVPLHPQAGRQQQQQQQEQEERQVKDDGKENDVTLVSSGGGGGEEEEEERNGQLLQQDEERNNVMKRNQQEQSDDDVEIDMGSQKQQEDKQDVLRDLGESKVESSATSSKSRSSSMTRTTTGSSATSSARNKEGDSSKEAFVMPAPQQIPLYVTQRRQGQRRLGPFSSRGHSRASDSGGGKSEREDTAVLVDMTSTTRAGWIVSSGFAALHERVPADWKGSVGRVGRWLGVTTDLDKMTTTTTTTRSSDGNVMNNGKAQKEEEDSRMQTQGRYFYNSLSYSMDADDCWSGTHWCCVFIGDDQDFGCFEEYCPGVGYYCV